MYMYQLFSLHMYMFSDGPDLELRTGAMHLQTLPTLVQQGCMSLRKGTSKTSSAVLEQVSYLGA